MENIHHFVTALGMLLCAILGCVVYFSNPHRNTNQSFAILSVFLCSWLFFRELALLHFDHRVPAILTQFEFSNIRFWVLQTIATSVIIFPLVQIVQLSYEHTELRWFQLFLKTRTLLLCSLVMFIVTQTGSLFGEVIVTGNYPKPAITSVGQVIYLGYYLGSLSLIGVTFWRSWKNATGLQAFELQFMLLGTVSGLLFGCLTSIILPALPFAALQIFPHSALTPLAAIIFDAFVAYGIVTRKIMDVKWFIRNFFAYGIVLACTLIIYLLAFFAARNFTEPGSGVPSVIASCIAVLSMMPLISTTGRLTNRLFTNWTVLDYNNLLSQADQFMSSINTTEDLLDQFSAFTTDRFSSQSVQIFDRKDENFVQVFPATQPDSEPAIIAGDSQLCSALDQITDPIDQQLLLRNRPVKAVKELKAELEALNTQVALRIKSAEQLASIMLIGPKESGRIYTSNEKETLQLLFNRLGTALRNAKLYTETENSRIYNGILLDNLVNGVIAVSTEHKITICNKEAQRILGFSETNSIDQSADILPPEFSAIITRSLAEDKEVRNEEHTFITSDASGEMERTVRVSYCNFRGQDGEIIGTLVILNDVTTLKKLEGQIRQNDRLASIGTLSAGMAHEIKNPLVSIKTFAQLLPERYKDADFRDTFSNIMDGEITRIDSIVNQLLSFARPAKPSLAAMPLHFVLDRTLTLVGQQLKNNNIKCHTYFTTEGDTILGDANQLEQVFLNFILNAIDSMPEGGTLTVKTHIFQVSKAWNDSTPSPTSKISVTIMDSGEGIPRDKQEHIFDPFFTTKSSGTGLGLSVAHGILDEHNCKINVESELDQGTVFELTFDLINQESIV